MYCQNFESFNYLSFYFIDFRIDFYAEKTHVILSMSDAII